MRTTLDLPDALSRELESHAARRERYPLTRVTLPAPDDVAEPS